MAGAARDVGVDGVGGDGVGMDFEIDGVRFMGGFVQRPRDEVFTLVKTPDLVARYDELVERVAHPNLVEIGVAYGGSTAYLALRARPRKLVAVEFSAERSSALDRLIEARGLSETVRPYYGVDQGDRARVAAIIADEFADEPLDLVVDDASHRYTPTLASFETLFPRLRPGGLFVVEDWTGTHKIAAAMERALASGDRERCEALTARIGDSLRNAEAKGATGVADPPLSRLVVELTLVQATSVGVADEVCVNPHWITVRRGPAALPADGFRLADHYTDPFGMISSSR